MPDASGVEVEVERRRTTPTEAWAVCADPMVVLDTAHWQGTAIGFAAARTLGVECVIAKCWHGRSVAASGEVQINAARADGLDTFGAYAWFLPDADLDMQVGAWTARRRERDEVPVMIDFEEPATKLRGRPLVRRAEYVVEKTSDRIGCRPLLYTGEWYMRGFCSDADNPLGVDSEILASCPLVLAAYPRKATTGTRYRDAVVEVCGGIMPAVPFVWRSRGIEPVMWQFDGDGGLYLPKGHDGTAPDVDVNTAHRTRFRSLRLELHDTDPAPPIEPGLQLGDERRTEWSHKIDPPSDDDA